MSATETFQIPENEYRAYSAIAKKAGFKDVDELFTTAIVQFFSSVYGGNIKPEDTEKFLSKLTEERAKYPDLDLEEFVRTFEVLPEIETEEITVRIPKKLLALVKVERKADLDEYLQNCLSDTIAADIMSEIYGNPDRVKAKYGLKEEFKAYEGH